MTVHAGHPHIADHKINLFLGQHFQPAFTAFRREYTVSQRQKNPLQGF